MPNPRRALPLEQWPEFDRVAWERAVEPGDLLDEPGPASHWRPKTTQRTVVTAYGLWLAWLRQVGSLDRALSPAARATKDHLAAHLSDLRSRGLAPVTIANRITNLREAVRVMQPGADISHLDHLILRLKPLATPMRAKRLRVISPRILLDGAVAEMRRLDWAQQRRRSRQTAERFRDALIVAFLATRPVRLANLAAIETKKHLEKLGDTYWCRFTGVETKEREPLEFPMPLFLTPWLDRYLAAHRPLLLRGIESSRLWITIRSTPMVDNTIYCRMIATTKKLYGRSLHPHLFRDCVATFIAEEAPEQVKIVARILGHSTLRTSEEHYNQAGMLSAQNRYLKVLAQLRQTREPAIG